MKRGSTVSILTLALCYYSLSIAQLTSLQDPLVAHIDSTVKPGDDFFMFANGKWFKENPIPASEQSNGIWQLIQDTINAQIRSLCETSASLTHAAKGSNKQKIGDFFFSGMDSAALNSKGIADLQHDLLMIDSIRDIDGIARAAAYIHSVAGSPVFGFGVGQDDKISSKYAVFIAQGGLSLPDRNYYFDADAQAVSIRQKFVEHARNMFKIMGRCQSAAGRRSSYETGDRHCKNLTQA